MHEQPNRCTLTLTDDQLTVIRMAQLRETITGLRAAADDLSTLVDNFPDEFRPGEISHHFRRIREDFGVLEELGFVVEG